MEFQSKVACEVGVNGAIMLQNIYFWVKRNEANDKNFYEENKDKVNDPEKLRKTAREQYKAISDAKKMFEGVENG